MAELAVVLSLVNFIFLPVILGKLFFSTHAIEFKPVEEIARLRADLGLSSGDNVDVGDGVVEESDDELDDFLAFVDMERAKRRKESVTDDDYL